MFFYAVHPFSSAGHNGLIIGSCVMYGANFVDRERRDGRCGLIYLMAMYTVSTQEINS